MLEIHFANRIESLTGQLVERLGAQRPGGAAGAPPSPFTEDHVVVPSAAMERHLTLALAQRYGICANLRFSYLARWLWQRIGEHVPGVADASPFDSPVLAWRVYAAFSDASWIGRHPRLAAWLVQADPAMRFDLATRVAGLIEQMTVYRPDWLAGWLDGRRASIPRAHDTAMQDEAWQAALWRRLVAEIGSDVADPVAEFKRALRDPHAGTLLPAAVHVFCLPAMPPLHLDLLYALSGHMTVHVYALNPCREYWLDTVDRKRLAWLAVSGRDEHREVGHRLLSGWGQQVQAQLTLLIDAVGETVVDDAVFEQSARPTLLGRLQDSILSLQDLAPGSVVLAADDDSVEFHACHSLTREIEVLHDRLLARFCEADPPAPADILVVVPDIDTAAPLIDAVLGTAPRERRIPYQITGRARIAVNASARALLELLALLESRFTASSVFALLQQPVVARRVGLDTDALERVRVWLQAAGVHWALDGAHRAQCELPGPAKHSFADGLDRLFLGYALPGGFGAAFADKVPVGDAEGADGLTLGALASFVDSLSTLRRTAAAPHPAGDWAALLADALEAFVDPDDGALDDLLEVRDAIDEWVATIGRSAITDALPLAVVRAALEASLAAPARGGVPTGAVTFASMASLRNLPYRFVCAIGLDDGAFPTDARPAEFDLIALAPHAGDRQRRIDERNVFLDLLLSARDGVYLSHVGRNVRDNAFLPPSVLVSELLDYLVPAIAPADAGAAALAEARARLFVEHPLQPFSEQVFRHDADPRIRSFHREYAAALKSSLATAQAAGSDSLAGRDRPDAPGASGAYDGSGAHDASGRADSAADADGAGGTAAWDDAAAIDDDVQDDERARERTSVFFAAPLPEPGDAWRDVSLDRLARFFRNPSRFLLEQRLAIALHRDEDEWVDDEPLVATPPALRRLADRLLPHALAGVDRDTMAALARAGTELPAGVYGERMLVRELAGLEAFALRVRNALSAPLVAPHTVSLALSIDGRAWRLSAGFADLRAEGLVRHRYRDARARDYLDAWLAHLMLNAAPPAHASTETRLHVRNGEIHLRPVAQAGQILSTLLGLYEYGLCTPLPFFPRAAWALVSSGDKLNRAKSAWQGASFGDYAGFAERTDSGHRLAWRGLPDPLESDPDAFVQTAHAVLDPLLAHLVGDPP